MKVPQAKLASNASATALLQTISGVLVGLPEGGQLTENYVVRLAQARAELTDDTMPWLNALDQALENVVEIYPSFNAVSRQQWGDLLNILRDFEGYTRSKEPGAILRISQTVLNTLEPAQTRRRLVMELITEGPSEVRDKAWNGLSPFCREVLTLTFTVHCLKQKCDLLKHIRIGGHKSRNRHSSLRRMQ